MHKTLKHYLNELIRDNQNIDARGVMQVHRIVELNLDDIFVELTAHTGEDSLTRRDPGRPPERFSEAGAEVSDAEEADEKAMRQLALRREEPETGLTLEELWRRGDNWVLLGDPGSGKTTVLKHLALACAQAFFEPQAEPAKKLSPIQQKKFLPLPVALRLFAVEWQKYPDWPADQAIFNYLAGAGLKELGISGDEERKTLRSEFAQALEQGRALLLLDGLDEHQDSETKSRTVAAAEALLERYPACRYWISSRTIGYYAAPLGGGFETATLDPFNDEQRRAFFHNWIYAVEKQNDINWIYAAEEQPDIDPGPAVRERAERETKNLLQQIDTAPGVKDLAANPLLCTIIALIYRQGGALPRQRVELYKLSIDTFIFNWENHKGRYSLSRSSLEPEETQAVLETVALHFQEHCPDNRAAEDDICRWACDFLEQERGYSAEQAQQRTRRWLALVRLVAGLMVDRGNAEYGFFHLGFQEYLAARAMTRKRRRIREYIDKYLFEPRWREVMKLAASHQGWMHAEDGSEFIDTILARKPHPHDEQMHYTFRMAFACMRETQVELETADALLRQWINLYWAHPALRDLLLVLCGCPGLPLRYRAGTLEPLIQTLQQDKNENNRHAAIQALGVMKNETAVLALQQALQQGKEWLERSAAAEALGAMKSETVAQVLQQALQQDKDRWVRSAAAEALGAMKSEIVVPALLWALQKDKSEWVRRSAAQALGAMKSETAVPALLRALQQDENGLVRHAAAQALGEKSETVMPVLLQTLQQDKNEVVRSAAAEALGGIKSETAVPALRQTLQQDKNKDVRSAAAEALGVMKSETAVPALLQALQQDKDKRVRRAAARSLGAKKSETAVPTLLQALQQDEDEWVRKAAAQALGVIKSKTAVPALLQALVPNKHNEVRGAAAEALGAMKSETAVPALLQIWQQNEVRGAAAKALGAMKSETAVPALLRTLQQDEDEWVRCAAANALGAIKSETAVSALLQALQDKSGIVRSAAADALEKIEMGSPL
ncbi:MAG: hypothetical protein GY862_14505 [Gammaproteobacteria bacterium]|nr:hypothetical protein [Gammaproteobacteria bacterium]